MLNLLIQKEFSAYVLQLWLFRLVLFASLLCAIFSDQLDGSLKRLFQSVKEITRKNPQNLIKDSDVDFSETKKTQKRLRDDI